MDSAEIRQLVLNREKAKFDNIMLLCDSPIEKKLLSNIYWFFLNLDRPINYEWIDLYNNPVNDKEKKALKLFNSGKKVKGVFIESPDLGYPVILYGIRIACGYATYRIFPQFPVYDNSIIRYTDFVIEVRDSSYKVVGDFVIECDGFQWHSTKEQLENDNSRNRFLTKHGYKIIRYTGSEINRIDDKFILKLENNIYHSIYKKNSPLYQMLAF